MYQSFLCPNHRQWISQSKATAERHMDSASETADYYLQRGYFEQAIPSLGCAWEAADILINHLQHCNLTSLLGFTRCSLSLADTFARLGKTAECVEVLINSRTRLQQCQAPKGCLGCMKDCEDALDSGIVWYTSRADYAASFGVH